MKPDEDLPLSAEECTRLVRALLLLTLCSCDAFDWLDNRGKQPPPPALPPLELKIASPLSTCLSISFIRCPESVVVHDFEIDCVGTAEVALRQCNAAAPDADACAMQAGTVVDICVASHTRARDTRATSSHCVQRVSDARQQCMFTRGDVHGCTKQIRVLWLACEQDELAERPHDIARAYGED